MEITAPAKINLGLRINGLRPDGYHEISSVFQEIDLSDRIVLHQAADSRLSLICNSPDLAADETNLCLKAARLLRETTNCLGGVQMELTKIIPMGAGLGGGSSDAAAVLLGLNRLWELDLDQSTLLNLAARLGSDVPFFIFKGCCLAGGRGEELTKIDPLVSGPMVLVAPNIHISTAWAYKNIESYRLTSREDFVKLHVYFQIDYSVERFQACFKNDFEPLVFAHYPILRQLKETLLETGAWYASLSGSGSVVFGIYREAKIAQAALDQVSGFGQTFFINL
jgi:4-diphosphocytidyl-2-C-methyl-D-erythritol kinase